MLFFFRSFAFGGTVFLCGTWPPTAYEWEGPASKVMEAVGRLRESEGNAPQSLGGAGG